MVGNKLFTILFRIGQYSLLHRNFRQFKVKAIYTDEPLTIIVNHSNFYDSLVLFELQNKGLLPKNTVAIINRQGSERFPLFKAIGTIPVSTPMKLSEYKNILKTMKTNNLLIFPQGKELHLEQRPITIEPGVVSLVEKNPQHGLLFVSLYYSFGQGIREEIACHMHYIAAKNRPQTSLQIFIEQTMEQQLDLLKGHVIDGEFKGYQSLW